MNVNRVEFSSAFNFSQFVSNASGSLNNTESKESVFDGKKEEEIKAKFDSPLSNEAKEKLEKELSNLNESIKSTGKLLRFKYNDEVHKSYVEVVDSETQEVVESLPPEFLIDLSIKMKELIGLFVDKKL